MMWPGPALAARYLKTIKLWGHDAHFDYIERWMRPDDPYASDRVVRALGRNYYR